MDHLSALYRCSSVRAPPPAQSAASVTGRAPTSRWPRLRLPIIATELEGHPQREPSRSTARASSSTTMASCGQPSRADLQSSRLCPNLRRHRALLLRLGVGHPDPRPAPPPLFSLAKFATSWRAVASESLSSLKPKIGSRTSLSL
jgi:hypothetical protein